MNNCKGSWNLIRGKNTKASPAYFDDWRCECGAQHPRECEGWLKVEETEQREPQGGDASGG